MPPSSTVTSCVGFHARSLIILMYYRVARCLYVHLFNSLECIGNGLVLDAKHEGIQSGTPLSHCGHPLEMSGRGITKGSSFSVARDARV
jgi:hypothetical protein